MKDPGNEIGFTLPLHVEKNSITCFVLASYEDTGGGGGGGEGVMLQ